MSAEKKLLFEIEGVKIYSGSIYVVENKEDLSAPTGFIKMGTSRLPSDGVDTSFQPTYKQTSATTGLWDTGFHEYSPCYKGIAKAVVEKRVASLQKNLVEPFEKANGQEGILAHNNDDFWTRKNFKIFIDQVFDTSEPEDLLALYFGLLTRELTPNGQEGNAKYKISSYVLTDKTKTRKRKDKKTSGLFRAIGLFEELLKTDRSRLIDILNYSNVTVSPEIPDDTFRTTFQEYANQESSANIEIFLDLVEETDKEQGRSKVEIYGKLKEAFTRGNTVTKNPNGVFFYEEHEIGPDLKSAATNISKTKDLEPVKKAILFKEEIENDNN
jgi:outer membrane lipoprotein-sorting protein